MDGADHNLPPSLRFIRVHKVDGVWGHKIPTTKERRIFYAAENVGAHGTPALTAIPCGTIGTQPP